GPATGPAPCRARRACSAPCRRATGRPLHRRGTPPPPSPIHAPPVSTGGTDRSSRSRRVARDGRRLRPASPTPARGRALAEHGRRRLRLLPSLHVKPDRKGRRLNSSHRTISYAVFCLKK